MKHTPYIIASKHVNAYTAFFTAVQTIPVWSRSEKNAEIFSEYQYDLTNAKYLGLDYKDVLKDFFAVMAGDSFATIIDKDSESCKMAIDAIRGTVNTTRTHKRGAYTSQVMRCSCCGKIARVHTEHILPISVVGSSYYENQNIQPMCPECNKAKDTMITRDNVKVFLRKIDVNAIMARPVA